MTGEIEGFRLSGIAISDLLLPEFVKKVQDAKLGIDAISLAFVGLDGQDNNRVVVPFVLNHQSSQEVKDKVIHLSGGREKDLKTLAEILKEVIKK